MIRSLLTRPSLSPARLAWPAIAALALAGAADAQPTITLFSINCGGGSSSAGPITLAGTIGQPDVLPGSPGMSGGPYTVAGGFWPGAAHPCPQDFDHSGTLTVQDIFDFLSAWFTNNPRADFNGVGGINIQDIFDFLAAWFAGCS